MISKTGGRYIQQASGNAVTRSLAGLEVCDGVVSMGVGAWSGTVWVGGAILDDGVNGQRKTSERVKK